ncbi:MULTISPECIES: DUF6122 family protein [Flavobacteriaceae]|uniref:DUF6122 family protein n=1 Tax=Flavobacteriaceae TaxID=49546 RepID=UPI002349F893|nr:DUF6122 family protein [Muricauda sp. SP22]MDC6362832.1 DUF6122 family protein [Muricauda sp. SP22]
MLRHFVHYGIHFLIPILIAFFFFKDRKLRVAIILLCGIVIDVDHFWANPLFDPNRCSIGFHPLHSYWAILGYAILPFFKPTRIIGLALLIHILADFMDCLLM